MSVLGQIKVYANEDISEAIRLINENTDLDVNLNKITYDADEDIETTDDGSCLANVYLSINSNPHRFNFEYVVSGDEIYCSDDVKSLSKKIKSLSKKPIESAEAVTAAGEDFLDDEEGLSTDLDNLADNVEDLQDQVEDVDEDDVNIDMDNNIDGHYIAECERCHGIFISATLESDQELEYISGICPICEKETNQYLKWVVKAVE